MKKVLKPLRRLPFALSLVIGMTLLSLNAFAGVIQGDEAGQIYNLIKGSGQSRGVLHIIGFVTERANPPIYYDTAYLKLETGRNVILSATPDQLLKAVQVLVRAGIEPGIDSGGTTYVKYITKVECASAELCTVE